MRKLEAAGSVRTVRRPRAWLMVVGMVLIATTFASGTAEAARIPGIDVSHWQNDKGEIDWTQVAEAGYRFTFIKATERDTYVDPYYGANRTDANAAGLRIGAYHFARPNGSTDKQVRKDARGEANHFLATGAPAPGDLYPVLDFEADLGGLNARRLKIWVRTWLNRVEAGTGVKPLIYTSPNTWKTRIDDTDEFALEGYGLWVAHYTTANNPMVFANNWGGNGWSFWQYTSAGSVPGIKGNVDLNHAQTGALKEFRIPVPPTIKTEPEISGEEKTGGTLTVSPGEWKGTKPIAFSYQWKRCTAANSCDVLAGATDPVYEVRRADYGKILKAQVTASNEGGTAQSPATSGEIGDGQAPENATVKSPDGAISASGRVKVRWGATDDVSDALTFDVRYREAGLRGAFSSRTRWMTATEERSGDMKGQPGRTYCYSARATDEAGNTSSWGPEKCVAVRADDRSLTGGGWSKGAGSAFYRSTYKETAQQGKTLKLKDVRGRRFDLLVSTCPGCGKIEVRFAGQVLQTISLKSNQRNDRVAIPVATFPDQQKGTLTIEVLSSGKKVIIDAVGVWRG
ncbi:MAG: hypothetical protein GEU71_08840 [Actinobacteria bacterium]|nr:hypothetical protein [Actinomycetota bacterium]